jgi:hypothetical protein
MKKLATLIVSLSATSLFAGQSMMPPMPPSFPKAENRGTPKSCKTIPMMLVHLPPPMQVEFDTCKNDMFLPFNSKTAQVLVKKFGKEAKLINVSVAEGFHRLYKVDFALGKEMKTIYTNETLTKFLDSQIIEFEEKKKEAPKVEIKKPVETKTAPAVEKKEVETKTEETK